jgi:hypothetical protein
MAAARIRGLTFSTPTILGLTPQALRWRLLRRLDPTLFQKKAPLRSTEISPRKQEVGGLFHGEQLKLSPLDYSRTTTFVFRTSRFFFFL